eukprot:CAMPEP_0170342058 /NCGR_PEP_ID=MMETSP0116_2-20130129/72171_1 /TAXON_ID=400756 /ORGANISM="Durinskia baltica, Strain CSIRO CS-38" /LENGTH=38 /DNA_ID= /DNA_START= /DNA_END= /DNA_ORIENTATION=
MASAGTASASEALDESAAGMSAPSAPAQIEARQPEQPR